MPNHAAVPARRVARRNVVAGTAFLAVAAAVLVTGCVSHTVSTAGTQNSAAPTSSAPATAAPVIETAPAHIALLETSAGMVQPPAEQPPIEPAAAPVVAPETAVPVPAEVVPAEQPAAPVATSAALSAEAFITGRTMYATEPVNVRNAPSRDGSSVVVALNARDQVTAGDSVDGWIPVHAGDVYGWVKSGYLADGTAPEPEPEPAPAAARAARAPAAEAPAADAPTAEAPAPAAASAGNWMEALIPQVDPNGLANWEFRRNGGWGASDGHTNYIDPGVPSDKRYSVMVHEYSHVLQAQAYGSLSKSMAALSAIAGSSATEKTADCMALMLGASWINYGCPPSLRSAASAILAGHPA